MPQILPHDPKVVGSNPASATKQNPVAMRLLGFVVALSMTESSDKTLPHFG
jgi:hypothetical protein